MNSRIVLRLSCFAAAIGICACSGSDAPKTPLGMAATPNVSTGSTNGEIAGEAKVALDSGNVLFRAKAYDRALAQYTRAAELAPEQLAPLLGIMMVADVTSNASLAEATLPRIRKLDPVVADSSLIMPHSKIIEAHPRKGS